MFPLFLWPDIVDYCFKVSNNSHFPRRLHCLQAVFKSVINLEKVGHKTEETIHTDILSC